MKNDKEKESKDNQISHLLKGIGQLEFVNKKLDIVNKIIESFEMKITFEKKNSQLLEKEIQNLEKIINELMSTQQQIEKEDIELEKQLNIHINLLAASNEQVENLNDYIVMLQQKFKYLEAINQKLLEDNQKLISDFNEKIRSAKDNEQQDNLNLFSTVQELIQKNGILAIEINKLKEEWREWKEELMETELKYEATKLRTILISNFVIHYATKIKQYDYVLDYNDDYENKLKNRNEFDIFVQEDIKIQFKIWQQIRQSSYLKNMYLFEQQIKNQTNLLFEQVFPNDQQEILDAFRAIFNYLYPDRQEGKSNKEGEEEKTQEIKEIVQEKH